MQLICIFVFTYGKDRFSHDSAQLPPNVYKTQYIHTENVQEQRVCFVNQLVYAY